MISRRWGILASMMCLILAARTSAAVRPKKAGVRDFYQPRATWWETMIASREALAEQEAAAERQAEAERRADPALPVFASLRTRVSNRQEPRRIKLRIAGMKRLYLGCAGRAEVFLGDPQLTGGDGQPTALPLAEARLTGGRGWANRKAGDWAQREYSTGVLLWDKEICVELDGRAEWLEGWVGARNSREDRHGQFWVHCRPLTDVVAKGAASRQALVEAVGEAFPSAVESRQQLLEAWLGIWRADWKPGDLCDLAARYAAACASGQKQAAEAMTRRCRSGAELKAVRGLFYAQYTGPRLALARKTLELVERTDPRPELAAELTALEKQVADAKDDRNAESLYLRACALRRRILLSHSSLGFARLLITKRSGFLPGHQSLQYLGRHSVPAPGLVVLDDWKGKPRVTVLLAGKLPPGGTLHPDLSYDGKRVLFAFADCSEDIQRDFRAYYIYEYSFESGEVRQITGTPDDPMQGKGGRMTILIEDTDPCYLPNGDIVFVSTRAMQIGRCHSGAYKPGAALYRCGPDGCNIRPISYNESNEWFPAVLFDGSIIYTRWDYINRSPIPFQSLWVTRPDGTQTAHFFGNFSEKPTLHGEPQPIPGTRKVVITGAPHHGQTLGTILIVDPDKGQDGGKPMTWVTPELESPEGGVPGDVQFTPLPLADDLREERTVHGRKYYNGLAGTPWPISEELFLCTYQHGSGRYSIYLIDVLGGRELIYADRDISCFDPIPLRPRPRPPILPSTVAGKESEKTGTCYIQDVYQGSYPIEPGSIKRLRINQLIPQPCAGTPEMISYRQELVKRILGTVPVREDGSAVFEVPARTPFQIQMLDANGMAVMTMRSLMYLQPGERISCIGCHEPRSMPPPVMRPPTAKVDRITPPVGPRYEGGFSFVRTVQPVLDRYCISCHGLNKVEKDINLLGLPYVKDLKGGMLERRAFSIAYRSLINSGRLKLAMAWGETPASRPGDYFARAGTLGKMLLAGHPDKGAKKRVELDRESLQRIVDWMDVNSQFYGDYSWNRIEWQPPSPEGEKRLREAIALRFGAELAAQPYAALVNMAMPSESRILLAPLPAAKGGWGQIAKGAFSGKNDPAWQEMLKLVGGSITPLKHHDIAGTCGRDEDCRCGGCWVRKHLAARRHAIESVAKSSPQPGAGNR